MNTTDQNSATSPWSKRRGFIRLGLLCFLSAFVAPFQSFAQAIPTINPGDGSLPVVMEAKAFSTRLINTRWVGVQAIPSTIKNGGTVTLTGQLVFLASPGNWRPLGRRNVTVQVGSRGQFIPLRTDGNGVVSTSIRISDPEVAAGKWPRGKPVQFRFTYGGDNTYRLSYGLGRFTVMR